MPVIESTVPGRIERDDAHGPGVVVAIKQQEFQRRTVLGEDGEIHAARVIAHRRAEGIRMAGEEIGVHAGNSSPVGRKVKRRL